MVRFKEREAHQIFLEPEGLDDTTFYPNGISTSLPADVQHLHGLVHQDSRRGVVPERDAIEYDFIDPRLAPEPGSKKSTGF